MKTVFLLRLAGSLFLLASTVLGQKPTIWSNDELAVSEKKFSVSLPAEPTVKSESQQFQMGRVSIVSYEAAAFPLGYVVKVMDCPMEFDTPAKAKAVLDKVIQAEFAKTGTIVGQGDVGLAGYVGRELWIKSNKDAVRIRSYVVKNRIYVLMVLVPAEAIAMIDSPQSRRFLDSFRLTEDWATDVFAEQYRAKSWKNHLDTEQGFSLWHPTGLTDSHTYYGQAEYIYGTSYWLAHGDGIVYWSFGFQVPDEMLAKSNPEKSFPGLAQLWSEMLNVKIESSTTVVRDGIPSLECDIRRDKEIGKARILFAKNRFLSTWAWAVPSAANNETISLFVNSLKPFEPQHLPAGSVNLNALDDSPPPPPPPAVEGANPKQTVSTEELQAHLISKRLPDEAGQLASATNAFGVVNVSLCVAPDGRVVCMGGQDGHPMLRDGAAFSAARWKFKPFLIDGKPTAVRGTLPVVIAAPESQNVEGVANEAFESRAVHKVLPEYPAEIKPNSLTGQVFVQVSVSKEGKVTSAVAFSGPSQFHRSAEKAARNWIFKPIEIGGETVQSYGVLTFTFKPRK